MFLLINTSTGNISDASHFAKWKKIPSFLEIIEVSGDVKTFVWPLGSRTRNRWNGNKIVPIPGQVAVDGRTREERIDQATTLDELKAALL